MYWGYLSSLLKASEKGQGDVLKANGCLGFLGIPFITKILQPKLEEGRGKKKKKIHGGQD